MSAVDAHGCRVTGATPAALAAYEQGLQACLSWHAGAEPHFATALREAPAFTMAHIAQAYLLVLGRDPRRIRAASAVLARVKALRANERERMHIGAIAALVHDDHERARTHLGDILERHPLDVLALHAAHSVDYMTGDAARLRDRVAAVRHAWSDSLPGHHAVLAMHAFGLVECGEYDLAEAMAHAALAANPTNARAHHALAHVFEMTQRAEHGVEWMNAHASAWDVNTVVATHCRWHLALFHLAVGRREHALALYDARLRSGHSAELSDLIDAAALLWRIELAGGDAGARWIGLANAWSRHIGDGFCSFTDIHAMLAFVGARDWVRARQLEQNLAKAQALRTRHGATTRLLGLPACRALMAFGRGNEGLAITLFASLPAIAHRLGGSHAQRDVLHLTLLNAIDRTRRPMRSRSLRREVLH